VRRAVDRRGYLIAVKREAQGRGGSACLHDKAVLGSALEISVPKGEFTLVEQPEPSCFVAGGIGITPLLPMIERLAELGHPWQLHYAAASPAHMAFHDRLMQLARSGGQVFLYFSDGSTPRMDVGQVIRALDASPAAHFYCCGPARMVDDFLTATKDRPSGTVHHERFASAQPLATEGGYTVELASTGQRHSVPSGKTILDVLLAAGMDMPYSCGQGVCGSCYTKVISGDVDHRDCFLTEDEQASNSAMLICCSGARSGNLVLDL
jgi:ferredoxin-NADP reductase